MEDFAATSPSPLPSRSWNWDIRTEMRKAFLAHKGKGERRRE